MSKKQQLPQVPDGVRYARWSGHALGVILIGLTLLIVTRGLDGIFDAIKVSYFIFYGICYFFSIIVLVQYLYVVRFTLNLNYEYPLHF